MGGYATVSAFGRDVSQSPDFGAAADRLHDRGFVVVCEAVDFATVVDCRAQLSDLVGDGHAIRHVHQHVPSMIACLIDCLAPAVARILGPHPVALDATLFRKPPMANWKVPWHQDLLVATRSRVDQIGWGPWSRKEGVWHVQPPTAILERLLAVRIHLSDCGSEDGPLRLQPGSHREGILPGGGIADQRVRDDEYVCTAKAGDVLLMRPLLLHSSRIARGQSDRMVLHLVLGPEAMLEVGPWRP